LFSPENPAFHYPECDLGEPDRQQWYTYQLTQDKT